MVKAPVSFISVAYGNGYAKYVPQWWQKIQEMNPQPQEVIMVHNPNDETGVKDLPITLIEDTSNNLTKMHNIGFRAVTQPWMCSVSLDDWHYPNSLQNIDSLVGEYDFIGANSRTASNQDFTSNLERIRERHCHVRGMSVFSKRIFDQVDGWPEDIYWSDFAFWWKILKAGAKQDPDRFVHTFIDDTKPDSIERGAPSWANSQMANFMNDNPL
jgi:hypothetical protein